MTEVKNMETMIATENQQEATEVMAFLGELEPQEKKDFLVFMRRAAAETKVFQKSIAVNSSKAVQIKIIPDTRRKATK